MAEQRRYMRLVGILLLSGVTCSCDTLFGPSPGGKWVVRGNNSNQCTVIPADAQNPFYPILLGTYDSQSGANSALQQFKSGPCSQT